MTDLEGSYSQNSLLQMTLRVAGTKPKPVLHVLFHDRLHYLILLRLAGDVSLKSLYILTTDVIVVCVL